MRTWPGATELPPEEPALTRAARRARLEAQQADGDEETRRRADDRLRRDREDARERERLRNGRKRPDKHLPAGLVPLYVESGGCVSGSRTPKAKLAIAFRDRARALGFVRVGEALASDARIVRDVFERGGLDVEAYDEGRALSPFHAPRMIVRREIAEAIGVAASVLRDAWISIAVELATDAVASRVRGSRGAVRLVESHAPPTPTTAGEVLRALQGTCRKAGLPLPERVDLAAVEWMLGALAIGGRGGGRSGRIGAEEMRATLVHPARLATAIRPSGKP